METPGQGRRELTAREPGRLDAVLAAAWPEMTRARVQRLIATGAVTVNGVAARKSQQVAPGDLIVAEATDDGPLPSPAPAPDLQVLYEDEILVVVNKPPGIVVHPGAGDTGPTVTAWFANRHPSAALALGPGRPGVVHRLDRDTSGVLVLAKTPAARARLAAAFERREADKTYVAVCDGSPRLPRGLVDAPLGRHPGDRTRMAVVRRGREATTAYEVVASSESGSLVECRPKTGRTHQVRVHLAAVGAPVAGDRVYGEGGEVRQLLHAWRLALPHPGGGRLEVTAPLPADMAAAVAARGLGDAAVRYLEPAPPRRTSANEPGESE